MSNKNTQAEQIPCCWSTIKTEIKLGFILEDTTVEIDENKELLGSSLILPSKHRK